MIEVAVACTTTATDWISRVTTCVRIAPNTMPTIALGSGSPVGVMIVVSAVVRKEKGMLTTWAIAPNTSEISRMTPSAGQNRPRISVQDRAIAPRIVACSRMIAAGTSSSLVDSHSVSGIAASTTRIVRPTATGSAAKPSAMMLAATTAMRVSTANVSSSE